MTTSTTTRMFLSVLLLLTILTTPRAEAQTSLFADGFESGNICEWSATDQRTWLIHVGPASGGITVAPPSPATLWDANDSGFSGEWLVQFDNTASADEEIVSRAGVFRLIRQADGNLFFESFDNVTPVQITMNLVPLIANKIYHISLISFLEDELFTHFNILLRDVAGTILQIRNNQDNDIDETPATSPFVFGGNGTDQMSGLIHYARWWTGVERPFIETLGIEDLPDDDPGLELQLRMDEGIGGKTFDRTRPLVGVLEGSATWKKTCELFADEEP